MSLPPLVFFGPFDRHNLGDLLFPHLLAERHPGRETLFAGLADRDMTCFGGHRVVSVDALGRAWAGPPADLLHVGGEILDCDAWTAAVMLCEPGEAAEVVSRLDRDGAARTAWAAERLGTDVPAPYVLDKSRLPWCRWVGFHAVGGVDLGRRPAALGRHVSAALAAADRVGVRDSATRHELLRLGVGAKLEPDAAMVPGPSVRRRIEHARAAGEAAAVAQSFPHSYLAVQFSSDFGDDRSLDCLASGLRRRAAGRGLVFLRAGAAPWHDEEEPYARLGARLGQAWRLFASLDIWQLAAVIAGGAGWIGSSLHGAMLARQFRVPQIGLERFPGEGRKLRAWVADWAPGLTVLDPEEFARQS